MCNTHLVTKDEKKIEINDNAFQSQSTLYSYLNVKELPARNRRDIWNLMSVTENRTRTHNQWCMLTFLMKKVTKWSGTI